MVTVWVTSAGLESEPIRERLSKERQWGSVAAGKEALAYVAAAARAEGGKRWEAGRTVIG